MPGVYKCRVCGCADFEIEVDNRVVKICCQGCNKVYFHNEIAEEVEEREKKGVGAHEEAEAKT